MAEEAKRRRLATRLVHPDRYASTDFKSLAMPTWRGSTVVFDRMADVSDASDPDQYRYGLYGTPTVRDLAIRIAAIEGAEHCLIVPSGQAAIALPYLAFCKAGDHVLLTESAYGPNTDFAADIAKRMGIEVERYDPMIGADIAGLIRDNTSLIWTESPGSITMEIQDVRAICAAAKERGLREPPKFLSTHPVTPERIARLEQAIAAKGWKPDGARTPIPRAVREALEAKVAPERKPQARR